LPHFRTRGYSAQTESGAFQTEPISRSRGWGCLSQRQYSPVFTQAAYLRVTLQKYKMQFDLKDRHKMNALLKTVQ